MVKGKFSYLSPEAASGKEVDRRADIFAVGILLYELLTGKRLFYGETDYQTVELVRQAKVPPIAAQNPEVDAGARAGRAQGAGARRRRSASRRAGDLQDALAQYLFSQRLKVTSRDIEQLVQGCLREKQRTQPEVEQPRRQPDRHADQRGDRQVHLARRHGRAEHAGQPSPPPGDSSGNAPLDPGLFVDTRGWADESSDVRKNVDRAQRRRRRRGSAARKKKDDTGNLGLEELLEGGDESTGAQAPPQEPDGRAADRQRRRCRRSPQASDARGAWRRWSRTRRRGADADEDEEGGHARRSPSCVVVLVLVLASAGMAIYYLKH